MRVLVTGSAGRIGRVVCAGLLDRGHEVAGLDLHPEPEGWTGPWSSVDCADPDAVRAVLGERPCDGVVHLAGIPDETGLADALRSHVVTTAALLDAMLEHDVTRIVYASSGHAVGFTPRHDLVGVAVPPRPDTFYGLGKVAAEALLSLYADRHGLDAIACRIGAFLDRPHTTRHLAIWLSHDDCVRMVEAALTAPAPGYRVIYGISANRRAWWDLDPGRDLGYHPRDDAEDFAGSVEPGPTAALDATYLGGGFTSPDLTRPAFERR